MANYIMLLAPERLHQIIEDETKAGRRDDLARALLRLIELHCSYLKDEDKPHQGTILPQTRDARSSLLTEISWGIIANPRPGQYGGTVGDHVLNGALILHSDATWSNHT